jgi:hypothetical protein
MGTATKILLDDMKHDERKAFFSKQDDNIVDFLKKGNIVDGGNQLIYHPTSCM